MAVFVAKAVLCCELEVRIDSDGKETESEIREVAQIVFDKYKDIILGNILEERTLPVGELFPLTIANNDKMHFFIPKSSLKRLCEQIQNSQEEDFREGNNPEDEYVPRFSLS